MVKFCNLADQQAEGRVAVFPFIILSASQFLRQNALQLLVIGRGEGNIVRQLVDSQGVTVFLHKAVYLLPVVFKVIRCL